MQPCPSLHNSNCAHWRDCPDRIRGTYNRGKPGGILARPVTGTVNNPYIAGLVTSAANPYFWIWWLTIGSAMVIAGLAGGIALAAVFMAGHWCADLGWYTFVSAGISRGRAFLSDLSYRRIMGVCGVFLILFGAYYLSSLFLR